MVDVDDATKTRTLPTAEAVPRTSKQYRIHGIRMNGEFNIGLSVLAGDGSVDDISPALYDAVSAVAEENIDVDRLSTETTESTWPDLGVVTVSPVDDTTVSLSIEDLPSSLGST